MFGIVDDSEFDENDNIYELLGIVDGYNYAAACSDGDFVLPPSFFHNIKTQGEVRLQQFRTALLHDRVGIRRMQGLHFLAVNGHRFCVIGAEIDTHYRLVLRGTEQRVTDVLRLHGHRHSYDDGHNHH